MRSQYPYSVHNLKPYSDFGYIGCCHQQSQGQPITFRHQMDRVVLYLLGLPLFVAGLICSSHNLICRTMTDELMACLVISWLAGALSSPKSFGCRAGLDRALQPAMVGSQPSIRLKKSTLSDAICEIKLWLLQIIRSAAQKHCLTYP